MSFNSDLAHLLGSFYSPSYVLKINNFPLLINHANEEALSWAGCMSQVIECLHSKHEAIV
jgi:hypothetical protein